jgi:hypothetical protein
MNIVSKVVRKEVTMVLESELTAEKIRHLKDVLMEKPNGFHSVELRVALKAAQKNLSMVLWSQPSAR